jgi:hypothetical protein
LIALFFFSLHSSPQLAQRTAEVQQLQHRLSHAAASNAQLNDSFRKVRLLASWFFHAESQQSCE